MANFSEQDFAKFLAFMRKQKEDEAQATSTATITETPEPKVKAAAFQAERDEQLDSNLKNDFVIEERLRSLVSQSKFYEAVSLSEDIESIDEMDIGLKLLIAECYIQLGRESKAEKNIKDIEKILMKPPKCSVDDVMALALDFNENSDHVRALLLLRIASEMFYDSYELSPDDKVGKIFRCISKMDDVIDEMVKPPPDSTDVIQNILAIQRALGVSSDADLDASEIFGKKKKLSGISERTRVLSLDYGVEVMEEMLEKLNSIKDGDPEHKTLKLARAAILINSHYPESSQFSKAVKVLKLAIDQLEKQFGKNARQHRTYANALYNIGGDYNNSEKFREAEVYVMHAVEAVEYALDFQNEEERRKTLSVYRRTLQIVRAHIKMA